MLKDKMDAVRKKAPLVHNMTNYVTINDCANITLACGASPIMAEAKEEVEEIVSLADGLNLNIGMLTKEKLEAMLCAGKKANCLGKPVVLDPVGAGASSFRKQAIEQLLSSVCFTVIRGNLSEIRTIASGMGEEKGVDSTKEINAQNLAETVALAKRLSQKTGAVMVQAVCYRQCLRHMFQLRRILLWKLLFPQYVQWDYVEKLQNRGCGQKMGMRPIGCISSMRCIT